MEGEGGLYILYSVAQEREIEGTYPANKPETALYRAPTFSLLLASHGVIVHDHGT